jgi:NAD(P)-dependent dehydrogenase (short-subunit alcohol dehydrogenase family)
MLMHTTLILGGDSPHGRDIAHRFYGSGNAVVLAGTNGDALAAAHRSLHRTDWVKPVAATRRDTISGVTAAAVALENFGGISRVVTLAHIGNSVDVANLDDLICEARSAASAARGDCPVIFVILASSEKAMPAAAGSGAWQAALAQGGTERMPSEHSLIIAEESEADDSVRIADRVFEFCATVTAHFRS